MFKGALTATVCIGLVTLMTGLVQVSRLQASEGDQQRAHHPIERPSKHATTAKTSVTPSSAHSTAITLPDGGAKIVIIIDDIGNQWRSSKRSALLQGDVTLAILPFTPYAQKVATLAQFKRKEIMLHAPMEPLFHRGWTGGLTRDMNRQQFQTTLRQMIAAVPGAIGVNNHMGSALTQNPKTMSWVMETLAENNLYFVDSRTTAQTQALTIAKKFNVPSNKRDVFLDNNRDIRAIQIQLARALRLAKKNGLAIAIGHPYPETLTVLEQSLPSFTLQNVTLITASEAILQPTPKDDLHSIFNLTSSTNTPKNTRKYFRDSKAKEYAQAKVLNCALSFADFFKVFPHANLAKCPHSAANFGRIRTSL